MSLVLASALADSGPVARHPWPPHSHPAHPTATLATAALPGAPGSCAGLWPWPPRGRAVGSGGDALLQPQPTSRLRGFGEIRVKPASSSPHSSTVQGTANRGILQEPPVLKFSQFPTVLIQKDYPFCFKSLQTAVRGFFSWLLVTPLSLFPFYASSPGFPQSKSKPTQIFIFLTLPSLQTISGLPLPWD